MIKGLVWFIVKYLCFRVKGLGLSDSGISDWGITFVVYGL